MQKQGSLVHIIDNGEKREEKFKREKERTRSQQLPHPSKSVESILFERKRAKKLNFWSKGTVLEPPRDTRHQSLRHSRKSPEPFEGLRKETEKVRQMRRKIMFFNTELDLSLSLNHTEEIGEIYDTCIKPFLFVGSSKKKRITQIFSFFHNVTIALGDSNLLLYTKDQEEEKGFEASPEWCEIAEEVWKINRWPEIFFLIGRHLKSTFIKCHMKRLKYLFSKFAHAIEKKSFRGKCLVETMAYDAVEYLSSHSIDPCNLFLGCSPSQSFQKKMTRIQVMDSHPSIQTDIGRNSWKNESVEQPRTSFSKFGCIGRYVNRWNSLMDYPDRVMSEIVQLQKHWEKSRNYPYFLVGKIVSVKTSAFPDFLRKWFLTPQTNRNSSTFCRVLSVISTGLLEVTVDPCEQVSFFISFNECFCLGEKEEELLSAEKFVKNKNIFEDPLFDLYSICIEEIEKEVSVLVKEAGISVSPSAIEELEKSPLSLIETIHKELHRLRQLRSDPGDSARLEIDYSLNKTYSNWIELVPVGLLAARVHYSFDEIDDFFKVSQNLIGRELTHHHLSKTLHFTHLRNRLQAVLNGERKNSTCSWWLTHIEKNVEEYLVKLGYNPSALPENYTAQAPENLEIVKKNRDIIINELDGSDRLDLFVHKTIGEVYEKLDVLIEELIYVCKKTWKSLGLDLNYCENEREIRDLEYLRKVKSMDEDIQKMKKRKLRAEMTDVVPVAGLVMARFHILQCEFDTALEIWGCSKNGEEETNDLESEAVSTVVEEKETVGSPKVCDRCGAENGDFRNCTGCHRWFCTKCQKMSAAQNPCDNGLAHKLSDLSVWIDSSTEMNMYLSSSPPSDFVVECSRCSGEKGPFSVCIRCGQEFCQRCKNLKAHKNPCSNGLRHWFKVTNPGLYGSDPKDVLLYVCAKEEVSQDEPSPIREVEIPKRFQEREMIYFFQSSQHLLKDIQEERERKEREEDIGELEGSGRARDFLLEYGERKEEEGEEQERAESPKENEMF